MPTHSLLFPCTHNTEGRVLEGKEFRYQIERTEALPFFITVLEGFTSTSSVVGSSLPIMSGLVILLINRTEVSKLVLLPLNLGPSLLYLYGLPLWAR
nr:hypothetical protein Q903MT_gene2070 [Picea sitchensis]